MESRQDQEVIDSLKKKTWMETLSTKVGASGGRQRSASVGSPEVAAASAAGDFAPPLLRLGRPRSRSSISAPAPAHPRITLTRHMSSLGESSDISALSVEVAVAEARESQFSPSSRVARQQAHRRATTTHRRTKSMCAPMSHTGEGFSTPSRSSRLQYRERGRSNMTQASSRVDNSLDEDTDHIREESQLVIRRHQPQVSRPSVIDLFNLPQPNAASYSRPSNRSKDAPASLTAEEVAASIRTDGHRRTSRFSPRHAKPHDQIGFETERWPTESSTFRYDSCDVPRSWNKNIGDRTPQQAPQTGAVDGALSDAAFTALSSVTLPHELSQAQQRPSQIRQDEVQGPVTTAAEDATGSNRIFGGDSGELLWLPGDLENLTGRRERRDSSGRSSATGEQVEQLRSFDSQENCLPREEKDQAFNDLGAGEPTVPAAVESRRGVSTSHRSDEGRRVSSLTGFRQPQEGDDTRLSTLDEASRFVVLASDGRLEAEGRGAIDFDELEKGGPYPGAGQPISETAKTTSQTETPVSKEGTPRSRAATSTHVRGRSISSSYHGSTGTLTPRELIRRPSARIQNEAKHVAEQKRGVTTSYKNVEPYTQFHKIALFLVVMGVIIGLGSHGIDTGIEQITILGEILVERGGAALGGSSGAKFFFFWLYDICFTGIAAFITSYFAPSVGGSGIPAMKYMMDTDDVANKLKKFTVVSIIVKAVGLTLAAGGGLNIGKEGPYTHLAGMVSYQLMRHVRFFHDILSQEMVLRQVLAATVAVGLSSSFAATIGGVLFSIEITTLYYDVGNYFKAFVAAIAGTVAVSLVRTLAEGSSGYISRDFSADEFEVWQYPVCVAIGVLCGFLGPLYVNFRLHLLTLARKWGKHAIRTDPNRKWEYVRAATTVACLAATITAVLTFFPGQFTRHAPLETFMDLLSEGDLSDSWSSGVIKSIFFALPVSTIVWIITAAMGTSVTVPAGDFIQTVVIGASLGRLIGEALLAHGSPGVTPSTFAAVGAAAMSCGATQTISAAVVIMEMTGTFELDKPILLASVISFAFSRKFGLNIYDSVMALNGLESLSGVDMRRSEELTAKDIMQTDLLVVTCQTTIGELVELLNGGERGDRIFESYPVVTGLESMAFVGTISRKDLVHIVLTGGSNSCDDPGYFDYVLKNLPKKDLAEAWDKMGDILHPSDRRDVFERLPEAVRHSLGAMSGSAGNTARALKVLSERLVNFAPDISFLLGNTTNTFGKRGSGEPRDPRDRNQRDGRLTLNSLQKANWDAGMIDNFYDQRDVDITSIAQQSSGAVQIDRTVWKAHESMLLKNVYLLFTNLRCIRLFVISGDRLTGIISRLILYNAMSHKEQTRLGENSRTNLDRQNLDRHRGGRYPVTALPKMRRGLDIVLGRGPRHGL